MLNERIPIKGRLSISLNGKVVREIENLVVTTGTDWVAERISGVGTTDITKMVIGQDITGPTYATNGAATDATAGDMWVGGSAVNMDTSKSQVVDLATAGGVATGSEIVFSTTFLGTGSGEPNVAINEAGLLTSATVPVLIARTTFNVVNKDYNDEMTITWTITIASS